MLATVSCLLSNALLPALRAARGQGELTKEVVGVVNCFDSHQTEIIARKLTPILIRRMESSGIRSNQLALAKAYGAYYNSGG